MTRPDPAVSRYVARHPESRKAVEPFGTFLSARGRTIATATVDDVDAYRMHLRTLYQTAASQSVHAGWVRRLLRTERRPDLAVAAGADPLTLLPRREREAVDAWLADHPAHRTALRRIATTRMRRGRTLLTATAAEVEAYLRTGLTGLSPSSRSNHRSSVRRFYAAHATTERKRNR